MALEAVKNAYDVMGRLKTHLHQVLYVAGGIESFEKAFWRLKTNFEEAEEKGSGSENDALNNSKC